MNTLQRVELSNGTTVGVECDWEYDRNPCDKEPAQYHGEDDGWILTDWNADVLLTQEQTIEVHDELTRQGPNEDY